MGLEYDFMNIFWKLHDIKKKLSLAGAFPDPSRLITKKFVAMKSLSLEDDFALFFWLCFEFVYRLGCEAEVALMFVSRDYIPWQHVFRSQSLCNHFIIAHWFRLILSDKSHQSQLEES